MFNSIPVKFLSRLRLQLLLEKINGHSVSTATNNAASHPFLPILAYSADAAIVLFHTDTQQVTYLVASSSSLQSSDATIDKVSGNSHQTTSRQNQAIASLCWSPDGVYLAAGETGVKPRIFVWDWERQRILSELKAHRYGVVGLSFSPHARHLVSLGHRQDGYMYVWDWQNGARVAYYKSRDQMHVLGSSPGGSIFVVGGNTFLRYWRFNSDDELIFPSEVISLNGF